MNMYIMKNFFLSCIALLWIFGIFHEVSGYDRYEYSDDDNRGYYYSYQTRYGNNYHPQNYSYSESQRSYRHYRYYQNNDGYYYYNNGNRYYNDNYRHDYNRRYNNNYYYDIPDWEAREERVERINKRIDKDNARTNNSSKYKETFIDFDAREKAVREINRKLDSSRNMHSSFDTKAYLRREQQIRQDLYKREQKIIQQNKRIDAMREQKKDWKQYKKNNTHYFFQID